MATFIDVSADFAPGNQSVRVYEVTADAGDSKILIFHPFGAGAKVTWLPIAIAPIAGKDWILMPASQLAGQVQLNRFVPGIGATFPQLRVWIEDPLPDERRRVLHSFLGEARARTLDLLGLLLGRR